MVRSPRSRQWGTIADVTYLVEIPVDSGGRLRVQAVDGDGGLQLASRPGEIAAKAKESLEKALDELGPAIKATTKRLRAMSPDELTLEFGLVLTAESGAVIAKCGAEVHFTVSLTWKREGLDAAGDEDARDQVDDA